MTTSHTIPPPNLLMILLPYLAIPYRLRPILQNLPLSHHAISANLGQQLCPNGPVQRSQQQNAHSHNGKDVVRVSVRIGGAGGWDEGHNGEEDVCKKEEDDDGEVAVPGRGPFLRGFVVEVY